MIVDTLDQLKNYTSLHPRIQQALEFLESHDLASLQVGKYEIDGKEIHAAVSEKQGVPAEAAKFEAHDRYIDIQVCPSGSEALGWKPRSSCFEPMGYNEEKDVTFFKDTPDTYFNLREGQFAIFFPGDVHAPGIGEGIIRKLVIKVKL